MARLVVRIVGGVSGLWDYPELVEHIGRYLVRYEPLLAPTGEQWLWTTEDEEEALVFASHLDFHKLYLESIGIRPDGEPNRPITVFDLEIKTIGSEAGASEPAKQGVRDDAWKNGAGPATGGAE